MVPMVISQLASRVMVTGSADPHAAVMASSRVSYSSSPILATFVVVGVVSPSSVDPPLRGTAFFSLSRAGFPAGHDYVFFRQSGHRQQAQGQRQRREAGEHAFFHLISPFLL